MKKTLPLLLLVLLFVAGCASNKIIEPTVKYSDIIESKYLDEELNRNLQGNISSQDSVILERTLTRTLESGKTGVPSYWTNPLTNNAGNITPTKTYKRGDGIYCREYSITVYAENKNFEGFNLACRNQDGIWLPPETK